MARKLITGGLITTIATTTIAFPLEAGGAHSWAGLLLVVGALSLVAASGLLAAEAARSKALIGVVGFAVVGLYGLMTTVDASLLARGLPEVSVSILPAAWSLLALGLVLIAMSGQFKPWVRAMGVLAAAGHFAATVAVLFGAEMPPTGAATSDWPSLTVAMSKLLFWIAVVGWTAAVWRNRAPGPSPTSPEQRDHTRLEQAGSGRGRPDPGL